MDESISVFYEELVSTTMNPGSRAYLTEQHKKDFTGGVKAAVAYGATNVKDGSYNDTDGFLELVWSIPFFLWGGCSDHMSDDEYRIQQFVVKRCEEEQIEQASK